jgi:hypothetical protein
LGFCARPCSADKIKFFDEGMRRAEACHRKDRVTNPEFLMLLLENFLERKFRPSAPPRATAENVIGGIA